MLTKKRLAAISILMVVAYFIVALIFRTIVVGRGNEGLIMYLSKLVFLSISATLATAFILIFIFKRDFIRGQIATFNKYKYLLFLMVKRDFVTRYRKSILGVLWSLLNPLLMMLVMVIVFSYLFRYQIENFPVYFLSGMIIYEFFSEATTVSMTSVIGSESIMKKVYVPRYIFPLSKVISSLVQLGFSFIALLLVVLITGAPFRLTMLLFPVPFFYTFVFAFGVGMLMAAMTVFFRDLTYLYSVLMRILMFMTPIMYPADILPENLRQFFALNPLYHFVNYFRNIVMYGTVPAMWDNVVCLSFAASSLCFGVYVFIIKQDRFMLYI